MSDSEDIALLTEIRDLQEILLKARKWTRILLGLLVAAAFLYLLEPLMLIWLSHLR